MSDFRRLVETYAEVVDIIKPITSADAGNIVTIYENSATTSAKRYLPEDSNALCNGYIKSLFLYAEINSLSEAPFPEILATDSAAQKAQKALNIEWGGHRYRLDLYKAKGTGAWYPIGAISLINPSGYPYRTYNLQDLLTNALAVEIAEGSKIGCKITDCGQGYLKANDYVTVHGSVSEEVAVIETNSVLPPGVSLGNLAFQDKENVYIKNGIIEALSQALPIAAGGTGVKTVAELKALVKQPASILDLTDLAAFAGKILLVDDTGTAIVGMPTPAWATFTLQNSWLLPGGGTVFQYRKWANGLVEIRGSISRATAPTNGLAIATLPTGYRPDSPRYFPIYTSGTTNNAIGIGSDGIIVFQSGAGVANTAYLVNAVFVAG